MPTISQRIGLALACGTKATPVGFGLLVPGGRGKPGTEETSRTDGAGTLHLLVTVSVAIARQPLAHRTAGAFNSSRPHRHKMQRTAHSALVNSDILTASYGFKQKQFTKPTPEPCASDLEESNKTFDRAIRGWLL